MVVGELSLGSIRDRPTILGLLRSVPSGPVATHSEVEAFVEANSLYGRGLSLVDVHLLASVVLAPGTRLWTRDKRLRAAAAELGVEHH
jgi:predicted nucleic acid-binding protein